MSIASDSGICPTKVREYKTETRVHLLMIYDIFGRAGRFFFGGGGQMRTLWLHKVNLRAERGP